MERANDKMIEDLRDGRVALVEVDEAELAKSFAPINQKETQVIVQQPTQKPAVPDLKERIAEKIKEKEKPKESSEEKESLPEVETEQIEEQVTQIENEPLVSTKTEIEVNTENQEEQKELELNKEKELSVAKKIKFRLKIISVAVCICLAFLGGLAIHNAVEINKLSTDISQTQSEIKVDYAKYIYKISKLDDIKEDNASNEIDTSEIPVSRHLQGYPEELTDITEPAQKTNWFDKLIEGIRNFFGG